MAWQSLPFGLDDFSDRIQLHHTVYNFSKQAIPLPGDESYEIRTGLRVIITFELDGTAVVDLRIVRGHGIIFMAWIIGARIVGATQRGYHSTGLA